MHMPMLPACQSMKPIDFACTVPIYKTRDGNASCLQELQTVADLSTALHDVWREHHPAVDDCFTVWDERKNARPGNRGVRIDYVFVSSGLCSTVADCSIRYDLPQV